MPTTRPMMPVDDCRECRHCMRIDSVPATLYDHSADDRPHALVCMHPWRWTYTGVSATLDRPGDAPCGDGYPCCLVLTDPEQPPTTCPLLRQPEQPDISMAEVTRQQLLRREITTLSNEIEVLKGKLKGSRETGANWSYVATALLQESGRTSAEITAAAYDAAKRWYIGVFNHHDRLLVRIQHRSKEEEA